MISSLELGQTYEQLTIKPFGSVACENGAHQCFDFDENKFPVVDETECVGCNLYALVCPSPGAISMVRLDDGSHPQSWKERTSGQ